MVGSPTGDRSSFRFAGLFEQALEEEPPSSNDGEHSDRRHRDEHRLQRVDVDVDVDVDSFATSLPLRRRLL
jgi:hypothetical protein